MYTLAYDMPPVDYTEMRNRMILGALTQEFYKAPQLVTFDATDNTLFIHFKNFHFGRDESLLLRIGVSLGQLLMMSPS